MGDSDEEWELEEGDFVPQPGVPHTVAELDCPHGGSEEEEVEQQEREADKEKLASLQLDMEAGPITDFVDHGLKLSLRCGHCSCHLTSDSSPLMQGTCGYTLCDSCYCCHVKEGKREWLNPACSACKVPNSFQQTKCSNELGMTAVNLLEKVQRFAKSSLKSLHLRWKHHVRILEKLPQSDLRLQKRVNELEEEVEVRETAIIGMCGVQRKQAKKMRKQLVVATDNLVMAREEIKEIDQLIGHHEGGSKLYYLLCPICKDCMKTMGATPILYWLPERLSSVWEGLTVDDSEGNTSPELLAEMWKQGAILKMQDHIIGCIRVTRGQGIKEKDEPSFY